MFHQKYSPCVPYNKNVENETLKVEEQLMALIWKNDKLFLNDLIEARPEPKPATLPL